MAKATLKINGMTCEHCVKTVTEALSATDGVSDVKVNLKKGEATLRFDESALTIEGLGKVITEAGYEFVSGGEKQKWGGLFNRGGR
jgi:copper chaperone